MNSPLLRPLNPHGLRALGGALVWGLIEIVALARSRRSAARENGRGRAWSTESLK
ncbi:hypothetical protein [Variovorax defluvii]|uniref:hypothetical protein n=1 Tax=Variovorax defluvii TaxID=913761 RepID=UPI0031E678C0